MLRSSVFSILVLFTVLAIAGDDVAKDNKSCCGSNKTAIENIENLQTTCPVMGGEINKDAFVDHNGKRIYFCCQPCVEKFKEDPDAYLKKLKDTGVTLYNAPCCEDGKCEDCKSHKKTSST